MIPSSASATTPISDSKQEGENVSITFPAKLLGLSLSLTLFTVIWMGGNSLYIHYFLTHKIARDQNIAERADEILYLDSVIAESARSSNTGDEEFDKRYQHAIEFDLNKNIAALPEEELREVAHAMEQANKKIVVLDGEYISLLNQNRVVEAEKILHSPEYLESNKVHLDGRRKLAGKIRQASHQSLVNLENNIYTTLLLVASVIFAIFVAWFFAFRSIKKWRQELEQSRLREKKAKEDAEMANNALILSEQIAKESAKKAEEANFAKSEFLSNMSHELRTPMHAILGFSRQVLNHSDLIPDKAQVEKIRKIEASGNRLLTLLNSLLNLSKLEAGMADFDFKVEDISKAINQTLLETESLSEAKQIRITVENEGAPLMIKYDYKSMVQVFINLLSNAIKFSPIGSEISIVLSASSVGSDRPALLCRVRDNGTGIPENELDLIFDKFVQSSKTKSGAGGTGLGLAIVKQLVESHKGKIWANNITPNGTCMNLLLPLENSLS